MKFQLMLFSKDNTDDEKVQSSENDCNEISKELESVKEKNAEYEEKLKHVLADFQKSFKKNSVRY